ncbi:flagellar assembly protein FliH [Phenylobacterium sp. VNQ135]|uniref:FliH/SctL family protein n=1 Tax=Phenylobacterium sp. VNQ135 TaxID=3400922 RepID=UPI003C1203E8
MSGLEKFTFDTEFDAGGGVAFAAPRPKRSFTADEAEQLRQQAFAEGHAQAMASIAAQQAQALSVISMACAQALPKLAEVAHEHRTGSAVLALSCARAIADAALDRFPEAPVQAALSALAREIEAQPRLTLTAEPQLCEAIQGVLDDAARAVGFDGAIQVKPAPGFGRHAFTLDFGDGAATFDPAQAALRVTEALEAALAAEGLHAEPLIPGSES